MNTKLWQGTANETLNPQVEAYTVGNDHLLDQKLLGYDIQASQAHAAMLQATGLITTAEHRKLAEALAELHMEWLAGNFKVAVEHEDGHTAIELYLTEKLGPVGGKIHTGRSRNDQALVMMRLYLKDNLQQVAGLTEKLAGSYKLAGDKAGGQAMPGYTHGQKAMPTTVAAWLNSFGDGFSDMKILLIGALELIDQNPLGSAAGFGVNLPVDREFTAKKLGFSKVQANPMYCGLSRGLFELAAVQALNPLMVLAGKFAQDMLLFTSQEFDFFSLPKSLTTGSSIMPHKQNYDLFEIMRGHSNGFNAYVSQLQAISTGAGSGYNRDLQLTKGITINAFDVAKNTLEVLNLAVSQLHINKTVLDEAMTDELNTVSDVNKLVQKGIPFREAYQQVKKGL